MNILNRKLKKKEKEIYWQALSFILGYCSKPNEAKLSYINAQALEIGLSDEDIAKIKILESPTQIVQSIKKIECFAMRRFIIREMIMLAVSAHELQESEIMAIYKIGNDVGIDTDKIDDFFMWAAKGLEWQIEGAKLVKED